MKRTRLFIGISIVCILFSRVCGETTTTSKYNKEEVKAINQLVYKLIDAVRLSSFNKTNKPLIYIFDTRLTCDLEKSNCFRYKTNYLINKLKRKGIIDRNIDSISIQKFNKVKFIFISNDSVALKTENIEHFAGRFNLSRISFNKSFTVGYLIYSVYVESDSGWGGLMRIEKKNDKWQIMGGPMYVL
ncbi:MAG TPA: hypothetical protein VFC36_07595 [Paludibacter sp.]|nr:hypothetical protein [Paludibacter sp.]